MAPVEPSHTKQVKYAPVCWTTCLNENTHSWHLERAQLVALFISPNVPKHSLQVWIAAVLEIIDSLPAVIFFLAFAVHALDAVHTTQYTLALKAKAVIYVLLWQFSSSAVILCNVALDHNPEEDQTSEPAPPPPGGWAAQSFINRSESRSFFVRPSVAVMRQPAQMHGNSLLWKTTSHPDKELA